MNWEEIRKEYETSDITLKALAEKHDIKDTTIRSRKNREKWQRNGNATQRKNVAMDEVSDAKRKKGAPLGNSNAKGNKGNKNASPPKRNLNAVTHGFFSKFLPPETLEIMKEMQERSPADLIFDQIQIQYAAIIRAQQIMFVTDKEEMIKELKKRKVDSGENYETFEEEYEFQFAWDRHATFLNAQSRAMSELRGLIKQFNELAHDADERRLKLEQMRLSIKKTEIEIDNMDDDGSDDTVNIVISRKEARG
ncbi:phage terminase small subunit [Metabacillus fastidiosus]|uniref:phage terminase small subunit n=1 Tax=Metabacillus fastidiosus TaxID=1458 RepID=UPI002E21B61C|nr:phage terminase small subunit [Metabacillus fastidiosus]